MSEGTKKGHPDLNENTQPKAADASRGEFSAHPKAALPESHEKSMRPKAPTENGKDQASVQPVSALPDAERDPPPANKK